MTEPFTLNVEREATGISCINL